MCGICGRFNLDGQPVFASEIASMRDVMEHRGPDGHGHFVHGPIGLGHRRLSIIDLAGGHQPLSNEDGTITVVFNGEIYNFQDLRPELEARGHSLVTRSDTEVIVHSYEELGAGCVERFRGMFTFALWDARRRELLLARDRLGVKPLYYLQTDTSLIFASEIKAILQATGVEPEIDQTGLRRYLTYRQPYGNGTLFRGIRQLPPGHVLVANDRGIQIRRYWDLPEQEPVSGVDDREERFFSLLDESVKLRLISDVPVGAFLSGGLDSSVVAALMRRHTNHVRTFSVGFVPGEQNELQWAKFVAEHCGADHHEFVLEAEDFFTLMQRLVWHHDEPMMFPASIPLYLLSRESKNTATVMLAGEGADEILAGYDGNVKAYWLSRAQQALPRRLWHWFARAPLPARAAAAVGRLDADVRSLIMGNFQIANHQATIRACRLDLPDAGFDDQALADEIGFTSRRGSFLDQLLYFQAKTYLAALLLKQDKMSMAASIETRVPYLDHHLVAMCFRLGDDAKVNSRSGKRLLKDVAERVIPLSVIHRRKQGFPVPISKWLAAPANPFLDVLLDPGSLRDGLIDAEFVRGRVEAFRRDGRNTMELWSLLNLELWRREFLHGSTIRARAVAS